MLHHLSEYMFEQLFVLYSEKEQTSEGLSGLHGGDITVTLDLLYSNALKQQWATGSIWVYFQAAEGKPPKYLSKPAQTVL